MSDAHNKSMMLGLLAATGITAFSLAYFAKKYRGQARASKYNSDQLMKMEDEYAAHNYHPLPVVFERAQGVDVWDVDGKHYYDFLSAYSAVNQGHCHPRITQALVDQAQTCALSSRAFFNSQFPLFAKYMHDYFGFEMVMPMNSGAEAVETALKMARKWGHVKKKIPETSGYIISVQGCFHGRTLLVISLSTDADMRDGFGPFCPGTAQIPYNDANALRQKIKELGPENVTAFILEPIQGEAGVFVPDDGYLKECYNICKENNVLFIADEIQTGLARTGKLLAVDHEDVKPDILILGKALSGGVYPVSAVLARKEIMLCIKPGEHGSTFGGNPVGSAVAMVALDVLKDENLAAKADYLGKRLRKALVDMKISYVQQVRGKGLLNAIVIDPKFSKSAWHVCLLMASRGVLAKPTHDNIIRLAPPLVITEKQLDECIEIIRGVLTDIPTMKVEDIPHYDY